MTVTGRVQNGVVVLPSGTTLPEGAEVLVSLRARGDAQRDKMPAEQRQQYLAALARIDAVPNENPGDHFSGSDHDQILYGERE